MEQKKGLSGRAARRKAYHEQQKERGKQRLATRRRAPALVRKFEVSVFKLTLEQIAERYSGGR